MIVRGKFLALPAPSSFSYNSLVASYTSKEKSGCVPLRGVESLWAKSFKGKNVRTI